jgi:RND family efflux transporter MFP subunit
MWKTYYGAIFVICACTNNFVYDNTNDKRILIFFTNNKKHTNMKKAITGIIIISILVGMGFMLVGNKKKIEESKQMPPVKAVAVSTVLVGEKSFTDNLVVLGNIMADKEINISSETSGKVTEVLFENGQTVTRGQTLVRIDGELRQANLLTAQVNVDKAQADLNRFEAALKDKAITEAQVEAARFGLKAAEAQLVAAKKQVKDTQVTAPFSGVITNKMVEVGSMLVSMPPTVIASLVDVATLKVKVLLAEKEAFKIKRGETVELTTDVYGSTKFKGIVNVIGVKADEAHNFPVEIVLQNNPNNPLRAGMFCKVYFNNLPSRNMVAIPREALVGSAKNPQVYVVEANKAVLRSVNLGAESGTYIEVLSGLTQGEQVVINGQINLNEGMAVEVLK